MREVICDLCQSNYYRLFHAPGTGSTGSARQPPGYKITFSPEAPKDLRLVQCYRCGLVFCERHPAEEELYRSYSLMRDEEYEEEAEARRLTASVLLSRIARLASVERILDVGCATGLLLAEARKLGWQAQGVELSSWAVGIARERLGTEHIFQGVLEDASYPYNYFDAVTMVDLLEHLPHPLRTLREVRRIQKTDGLLCVSTPDIASLSSRLLGMRWWGIQQAHLYYFSRVTLADLLDAAGFRVVKMASHPRFFSSRYITRRLRGYNAHLLRIMFDSYLRMGLNTKKIIKLNFGDQILACARKKRSLVFIRDDEKKEPVSDGSRRALKTVVVLPAYNAAKTLEVTVKDIPEGAADEIVLVDDASTDSTVEVAAKLGLSVVRHQRNRGYGANQKTCYSEALARGADIVVMVHPDYQYDPLVIPELIRPIRDGRVDAVFGSRMMKGGALEGGMPLWKHNANILLTAFENIVLGTYLTEYHSGFRAYSAGYLRTVNYMKNSDGFLFDTEIIVQGLLHHCRFEEVPIRTRYFDEASTIKFFPSVLYGLGIIKTMVKYMLHKRGFIRFSQFA